MPRGPSRVSARPCFLERYFGSAQFFFPRTTVRVCVIFVSLVLFNVQEVDDPKRSYKYLLNTITFFLHMNLLFVGTDKRSRLRYKNSVYVVLVFVINAFVCEPNRRSILVHARFFLNTQ